MTIQIPGSLTIEIEAQTDGRVRWKCGDDEGDAQDEHHAVYKATFCYVRRQKLEALLSEEP